LCYSEGIRLYAEVGEKSGQGPSKIQNVWDTTGPSDLRYKIAPYSDILAKDPRGVVIGPRTLESEKINYRMWAYAKRDGRPRNIGDALCSKRRAAKVP